MASVEGLLVLCMFSFVNTCTLVMAVRHLVECMPHNEGKSYKHCSVIC